MLYVFESCFKTLAFILVSDRFDSVYSRFRSVVFTLYSQHKSNVISDNECNFHEWYFGLMSQYQHIMTVWADVTASTHYDSVGWCHSINTLWQCGLMSQYQHIMTVWADVTESTHSDSVAVTVSTHSKNVGWCHRIYTFWQCGLTISWQCGLMSHNLHSLTVWLMSRYRQILTLWLMSRYR